MSERRTARNPANLIVGLALLLFCGMGGAVFVVLGSNEEPLETTASGALIAIENSGPEDTDAPATEGPGRRQVSASGGADADVAATLRGRVRAYRSREPVVGLTLTLNVPPAGERSEPLTLVAESDAKGVFRFSGLPPRGGYELNGLREPFAPVAISGIDLAPTEERDLGTIWLDVPVDLPVQVRGLDGTPVADATVAVFATAGGSAGEPDPSSSWVSRIAGLASTPAPTATATTDESGDAVVSGLLPGTYHVRATAEGRGPASKGGVRVAPDAAVVPLRLLLSKAYELTGTVRDAEDVPVAEALVIATPNGSRQPGMDKTQGETTEDGEYTISGLAPGIYTLYLARPEKPLVRAGTARIPDQHRVDLRLRPTATLLGAITDDEGAPIADAEVTYAPQGGAALLTRTGEDGVYRLEDVPSGASQYFRVRADGYVPYPDPTAPQQGTGESVREGAEIRRDVVLRAGVRVTVTVLAKDDDHPIEGAQVELRMSQIRGGGGQPWRATTDDDGVAEYPGIVPGTFLVVIKAPGFVQEAMPPWPQNVTRSPQAMPDAWRVTVTEAFAVPFRLVLGSSVSGVVRGPDGEPFAGARVSVTGARGQIPVFSDDEGKFTVDSVPVARRATATASAPQFTNSTSEPFAVPEGEPVKDIEIKLADGGTIKGRLRSSEGLPLEGAYVRYTRGKVQGRNPWSFRQFDRQTKHPVGPDGTFEITGVTAGAVTVRGDAEGHLPMWDSDVTVTAGQPTGGIDLILSPGTEISGRVDGPGGAPVAGALLNANYSGDSRSRQWGFVGALSGAPSTQSDREGRFTFRGLKPGNYSISGGAPGFAPAWVQTSTGAGEILLSLGEAESISGVVKGPDGKAMGGVPVQARNTDKARGRNSYWWWGGNRVFTAPDGSFEFVNLAKGAYDLTVSANWLWGRDVNVKDKTEMGVRSGRDDVEILVEAGTTIEGHVVDQDGEPITTGWVSAVAATGGRSRNRWGNQRWAQLGSGGTFKISGLEPGAHTVSARGSFVADPAQGVATGTTDLEIRVRAGFVIKGWMVDINGLSVSTGSRIQIRKKGIEKWNWAQVYQPGDGGFILVGLEDGAYDLKIQANPYAPMELRDVVVGTEDLEIVLRKGHEISGVITSTDGSPIRARIQARQVNVPGGTTAANGTARCDQSGAFTIPGLADGEYRLTITASRHAPLIVEPVRGGTTELSLVMDAGVSVSGTVTFENGDPVVNARLYLTDNGQQVSYARSQQDGTFTFSHVPVGGEFGLGGRVSVSGSNVSIFHEGTVASGATEVAVVVR